MVKRRFEDRKFTLILDTTSLVRMQASFERENHAPISALTLIEKLRHLPNIQAIIIPNTLLMWEAGGNLPQAYIPTDALPHSLQPSADEQQKNGYLSANTLLPQSTYLFADQVDLVPLLRRIKQQSKSKIAPLIRLDSRFSEKKTELLKALLDENASPETLEEYGFKHAGLGDSEIHHIVTNHDLGEAIICSSDFTAFGKAHNEHYHRILKNPRYEAPHYMNDLMLIHRMLENPHAQRELKDEYGWKPEIADLQWPEHHKLHTNWHHRTLSEHHLDYFHFGQIVNHGYACLNQPETPINLQERMNLWLQKDDSSTLAGNVRLRNAKNNQRDRG